MPSRLEILIGLALALLMTGIPVLLACRGLWEVGAARRGKRAVRRGVVGVGIGCAALLLVACLDATIVEPRMLTTTRVTIPVRGMPAGTGLTVVQLTDLHHTPGGLSLDRILARVVAERPDLIVVTGDVMEGSPREALANGRAFSARLQAIAPTVMVMGNHDVYLLGDTPDPFGGVLRDEQRDLTVAGVPVRVIGWDWPVRALAQRPSAIDPARVNILLTHTPDLLPQAAKRGADVAFAGHTHGGQLRLPFWGAVLTATDYGKRYEYGRYQVGAMPAFVSRGTGVTGPPMRFLCPPEIVVARLVAR
jgi:predicted MPP superfamily phosphohydrolase